jgi:hypothetical protein
LISFFCIGSSPSLEELTGRADTAAHIGCLIE